jgi:predicted unusual protein kinase regulating ubiquinone biosynthesis (AarF/ABC1/UbiB family)
MSWKVCSYIFSFTKLFKEIVIYSYYPNNHRLNEIVQSIQGCGCTMIKLTQWLIPIIQVNGDLKERFSNEISKLDIVYDNCSEHSIEDTERVYKEDFQKNIYEDYKIISLIASASMGQVYKVMDLNDNQYYALKVLHPDVKHQIKTLRYIGFIINHLPYLKRWVKHYIPFDLNELINTFEIQTNMVSEANNCMRFKKMYSGNECIIIPEILKVSSRCLVMSYEESEKVNELDTELIRNIKSYMLYYCFIMNNTFINKFIHGDLHKGNWGIRKGETPKMIIYDFGFCWELPRWIHPSLDDFERYYNEYDNLNYMKLNFKEFNEKTVEFFNTIMQKEVITIEDIINLRNSYKTSDDKHLVSDLLYIVRKKNLTIDSIIFNVCLLFIINIQISDKITISKEREVTSCIKKDFCDSLGPETIHFCEYYNIFSELKNFTDKRILQYRNEINYKGTLFESIEEKLSNKHDLLKELALTS